MQAGRMKILWSGSGRLLHIKVLQMLQVSIRAWPTLHKISVSSKLSIAACARWAFVGWALLAFAIVTWVYS